MSWFTSHLVDPMEISMRVADRKAMEYMEALIESLDQEVQEGNEEASKILERIKASISQLPEREADFVDLYYFHYKTQTEIAYLFRVSQPTVCYRLQRAAKRIHFLLSRPTLTDEEMIQMQEDLRGVLKDPEDVRIMVLMYETSCQSVAAKELGVSQGRVRHRLMRSLKILESKQGVSPTFKKYFDLFKIITSLPNILREVQRPTSSSRMRRIVDCDPSPNISSFEILGDEDKPKPKVIAKPLPAPQDAAYEAEHVALLWMYQDIPWIASFIEDVCGPQDLKEEEFLNQKARGIEMEKFGIFLERLAWEGGMASFERRLMRTAYRDAPWLSQFAFSLISEIS